MNVDGLSRCLLGEVEPSLGHSSDLQIQFYEGFLLDDSVCEVEGESTQNEDVQCLSLLPWTEERLVDLLQVSSRSANRLLSRWMELVTNRDSEIVI